MYIPGLDLGRSILNSWNGLTTAEKQDDQILYEFVTTKYQLYLYMQLSKLYSNQVPTIDHIVALPIQDSL